MQRPPSMDFLHIVPIREGNVADEIHKSFQHCQKLHSVDRASPVEYLHDSILRCNFRLCNAEIEHNRVLCQSFLS